MADSTKSPSATCERTQPLKALKLHLPRKSEVLLLPEISPNTHAVSLSSKNDTHNQQSNSSEFIPKCKRRIPISRCDTIGWRPFNYGGHNKKKKIFFFLKSEIHGCFRKRPIAPTSCNWSPDCAPLITTMITELRGGSSSQNRRRVLGMTPSIFLEWYGRGAAEKKLRDKLSEDWWPAFGEQNRGSNAFNVS